MQKILDEIKCEVWATPDDDKYIPLQGLVHLKIPSLENLLEQDDEGYIEYPYSEYWEQAKNEIVCIIHTSGTTGE